MDNEFLEWQVDNFNKLCNKAKEIIFDGLITGDGHIRKFFMQNGIADCVCSFSPIEQILYFAIILYKKIEVGFDVYPQKEIKTNSHTYKADFYIEIAKDKSRTNNTLKLLHPLIIECDGFNFHNSKEQMSYDYERENNLKLEGFNVIRFTGSQIYSNPKECVNMIEKYIINAIQNKEYTEVCDGTQF